MIAALSASSRQGFGAALLLWLVGAIGCAAGGETGNPAMTVPARVALSARSGDPAVVALASEGAGAVLDEAWVAFGRLQLLDEPSCAHFGDLDDDGPTLLVTDLAAPGARIELAVAPGDYCGLMVPLRNDNDALPGGAPAELADHSVVLRGRRADGTPFLLAYPERDELELAALDRISVDADGPGLHLSFDVAIWMEGIDLDTANVDADGTIRIDAVHNRTALEAFENNLECSLDLFTDDDGDGLLGDVDTRIAECAPDGS